MRRLLVGCASARVAPPQIAVSELAAASRISAAALADRERDVGSAPSGMTRAQRHGPGLDDDVGEFESRVCIAAHSASACAIATSAVRTICATPAAGAGAGRLRLRACSTSRATMRPCGPEPLMFARSIPASPASRRASGVTTVPPGKPRGAKIALGRAHLAERLHRDWRRVGASLRSSPRKRGSSSLALALDLPLSRG